MQQIDGSFEGVPNKTDAGPYRASGRDTPCSVLLAEAGRLLLEYNESTATIHRVLTETSEALTGTPCLIEVTYGSVTVSTAGESPVLRTVSELRYNTALLVQVREILGAIRLRELDVPEALEQLRRLEQEVLPYRDWIAVPVLGIAAASLARLLGADAGGLLVAGVATAVGLVVRKRLGRQGHGPLTLALAAALIGAVLGGLAFRFGWTHTPGVAIIVPALLVIPGPHLINGLLDLIDNHVPMSLSRLWLAAAILLANTLGLAIGIELTLPEGPPADNYLHRPAVLGVVLLSGVVTCGFAVFYNATWSQVTMAAIGGMIGNGMRDVALDMGARLDAATFTGSIAVGIVSAWMARYVRTPVAIVAFAGAVTMMPGPLMYQSLGGMLRMARDDHAADAVAAADLFAKIGQVGIIIGGLAVGLIIGARAVTAVLPARGTPPHAPQKSLSGQKE